MFLAKLVCYVAVLYLVVADLVAVLDLLFASSPVLSILSTFSPVLSILSTLCMATAFWLHFCCRSTDLSRLGQQSLPLPFHADDFSSQLLTASSKELGMVTRVDQRQHGTHGFFLSCQSLQWEP